MNKSGFTLVEVLVSASLLVFAAASFFYFFLTSLKMQRETVDRLRAVYAMQGRMEELRSLPFEVLLSQNGKPFEEGRGYVKAIPINSDLIEIQTTLKWHPTKKAIQLFTMRTR